MLEGRGGNDTVDGADDDDTYVFDDGWGIDIIATETGGTDTLRFSAVSSPLAVDLVEDNETSEVTSGAEVVNWFAGREVENVVAESGADSITGNEFANYIVGNAGKDTIAAAAGNDTVDASDGVTQESIDCGPDDDTVYVDSIRNPFGAGRITPTPPPTAKRSSRNWAKRQVLAQAVSRLRSTTRASLGGTYRARRCTRPAAP